QQEHVVIRHVERALDRQPPLSPEVSLVARLGMSRADGHEVIALADLAADLLIPRITADQRALVVPHLHAEIGKGIPDELRRAPILRGVAEEDGWARASGSLGVVRHRWEFL